MTEGAQSADELDEMSSSLDQGLKRLPRPKRTMRTVTIVVITITVALCGWLWRRLARLIGLVRSGDEIDRRFPASNAPCETGAATTKG